MFGIVWYKTLVAALTDDYIIVITLVTFLTLSACVMVAVLICLYSGGNTINPANQLRSETAVYTHFIVSHTVLSNGHTYQDSKFISKPWN